MYIIILITYAGLMGITYQAIFILERMVPMLCKFGNVFIPKDVTPQTLLDDLEGEKT